MSLLILDAGLHTLVQDGGRPGLTDLGVGSAGAFDRGALALANRLVGNPAMTSGLEIVGGGLRLRAQRTLTVAVAGAIGPLSCADAQVEHSRALPLEAGQELLVGAFSAGLRGYLAVAGGIDVPEVLGSRSRDVLAELGPPPLVAGDLLPVGVAAGTGRAGDPPPPLPRAELVVAAVPGPRDDWFTAGALETLFSSAWVVGPQSNRVGLRLSGPSLDRAATEELDSEPVVRGSIQVTRDGQPVILGPDHPVTGGYPVIAVVADADMDRLAQIRPGQHVRFRPKCAHDEAQAGTIAT